MLKVFAVINRFRFLRSVGLAALYTLGLTLSLLLAYGLRFDFQMPPEFSFRHELLSVFVWLIPLGLVTLRVFGQFNGLLSFFSTPDLKRIASALTLCSVAAFLVRIFAGVTFAPPRSVILANFMLSMTAICVTRFGFRHVRERFLSPRGNWHGRTRRVGIVGAGDVGSSLARELMSKRWLAMQPVAFFDDFRSSRNCSVHGIPVVGRPEALLDAKLNLLRKLKIEEVIIAMPSAPAKRVGEIVKILRQASPKLHVQTVPSMDQLATGQVKVSALRAVEIQDLLGRPSVEIETSNIAGILAGRVVMVTGAGGSIGSELCRQIASFGPTKILLIERSEPQIFPIEQELLAMERDATIMPLVADILDRARMEEIFEQYKPQIVFHAAAHKHVFMMERQPGEAIKNNVLGTMNVAELAMKHRVERFVFISTDKAINPTSVMGASKRLAEIYLQSLHSARESGTKIMAVRFGNVLGSSGSVVPIFTKQIAAGGPVKVTHPDVTRYFMTIPEAVSLVLQSAAQGKGGEIFVLDMGHPVKIIDLARQMIELSGLRPYEDIDIVVTGLRPGEKLYEELSHEGENITPTHHPKIMRFVTEPLPLDLVKAAIQEFADCLRAASANEIRAMLKKVIPEYAPSSGGLVAPAPAPAPATAAPSPMSLHRQSSAENSLLRDDKHALPNAASPRASVASAHA